MSLTSAVVGLGRVGIGYDINLPKKQFVLSHARALEVCPGTKLIAGVDNSEDRISLFKEIYKVPAFKSISDFLGEVRPDLIVISTPTVTLTDVAKEILDTYTPFGILIEKPISVDFPSALKLVERCENQGTELFVNYTRRSSLAFREVKNRILDGTFQGPFIGTAWYTNGILNNGSHLLNILEYLFGGVENFSRVKMFADRGADFDLGLTVKFSECEINFQPLPKENFFIFRFELYGANGILTLENGFEGFTWKHLQEESGHSDSNGLSDRVIRIPSDMKMAQLHVIDSLIKAVRGLPESICTGREGLKTLEYINTFVKSLRS